MSLFKQINCCSPLTILMNLKNIFIYIYNNGYQVLYRNIIKCVTPF